MNITPYSDIDSLIEKLLSNMRLILREKLVGLYLHGSLVSGDFDLNSSDIDLLAALSSDTNELEFDQLQRMHKDFAIQHSLWDDRVEVCYISVAALKTVKSRQSQIVNISPGEPIHRLDIDKDWLMKWYLLRQRSKVLIGPPLEDIVEAISKDEFIQCVEDHVRNWDRWLQEMPHNHYALSYAVLTMCRAFYSSKTGEQASKNKAAEWVQQELPAWSDFISEAIQWKKEGRVTDYDEINFQKAVEFVRLVQKIILGM